MRSGEWEIYRRDEMRDFPRERHADREKKRRAQITQPYGILLSPLLLPSCLSLQEEEDHLHSSPIYIHTPSLSSEPFSFPPRCSPVSYQCSRCPDLSACSPHTQTWVNRLGSHPPPSAHYRRSLLPLRIHWWLLLPWLTSASHSGQLMDTLLLSLRLPLLVHRPSCLFLLSTHSPLLPIGTSPSPNLSNCSTRCTRCCTMKLTPQNGSMCIYRVCAYVLWEELRVIETSTITSHLSFLCHFTYLPH